MKYLEVDNVVFENVQQGLTNSANMIIQFLPALIGAIIILIIGWIVGRVGGGLLSKLLQKTNIDETVGKTDFGTTLEKSGMTISGLFGSLFKWFIYLIFIMAAVNVLNIPIFADFLNAVVLYIPNLIAGVLVLVIGLIAVNFLMKWVGSMLKGEDVPFTNWIVVGLQALLSIVVIVIALDQWRIQTAIIYTFLVPLAWGISAGIAIAIGISVGVGAKDIVADYLRKMAETGESKAKEKMEEKGEGGKEEFREPGEGVPK